MDTLTQLHRGPLWVELSDGEHKIDLVGDGRTSVHTTSLDLRRGEIICVEFWPPRRGVMGFGGRDPLLVTESLAQR